jgi:hypothetical protein
MYCWYSGILWYTHTTWKIRQGHTRRGRYCMDIHDVEDTSRTHTAWKILHGHTRRGRYCMDTHDVDYNAWKSPLTQHIIDNLDINSLTFSRLEQSTYQQLCLLFTEPVSYTNTGWLDLIQITLWSRIRTVRWTLRAIVWAHITTSRQIIHGI